MAEPNHDDEETMYEEMFAYRYTSEDPDYQQTLARPDAPCPCVTGYFTKNRNQDRNRGDRGGWGRRGNWDNRDRGHWQHRDRGYRQDQGHYNRHHDGHNRDQRHNYGHDRGGYRHGGGGNRYNPY